MTRAAIYARYSSDKQSDRSVEDQVRLCQQRAEREGWQVTQVYPDFALSGATRDRPGLNALLASIDDIDVVLAESIDRLSRDQEDIAGIYKRLTYAGVRIVTLSEGEVGELHIGLGGTMGALYLKQLGEKTRRGQIGRVHDGKVPGGISYGYRVVRTLDAAGQPEHGRREIVDEEADVVRRIFAEYLAGIGPKAIATQLNAENIPSPRGGKWSASTILGNRRRQTGILNNPIYVGRIVYNRQSFKKHPDSRRRIARPNEVAERIEKHVPELAIVDQQSWDAVEARRTQLSAVPATHQRRAKRLFSGLVRCGSCGESFTVVGKERWGCSARQNGKGCDNGRTVSNTQLEERVLGAIKNDMLAPDVIAAFVAEAHAGLEEKRTEDLRQRKRYERELARLDRQIDRFVDAIGDGVELVTVKDKLLATSAERDRIAAELEEMGAANVIVLHPGIADVFRDQVANLAAAIGGAGVAAAEARQLVRGMITAIVAVPRDGETGLHLDVQGRLASILAIGTKKGPLPGGATLTLSMVAGTGFEPVTFRL